MKPTPSPTLSALRAARRWLQAAVNSEPEDYDNYTLKRDLAKIDKAIAALKAAPLPRVIVQCSRGMVRGVYSSVPLSYDVLDHDELEGDDPIYNDVRVAMRKLNKEVCALPHAYCP